MRGRGVPHLATHYLQAFHLAPLRTATPVGNLSRPAVDGSLSFLASVSTITTTLDLYGHLYPGEMDRYAARLDDATGDADAAKMRPDDPDEDDDDEGSSP